MAKFRNIKTSFWTDGKVVDDFSPEDKYFFLYLLTNPKTTQLGIYEFVPKVAAFDMGYSKEVVNVLLDRFENKYDLIRYSKSTGEIAIKNYLRHAVVKGGKPVFDCLKAEEQQVKDRSLINYLIDNYRDIDNLNTTVYEFIEYLKDKEDVNDNDNDNDKEKERIVTDESSEEQSIDDKADELFDLLWGMYPKKRGKGNVSATQKRKLLAIGYDKLILCMDRYLAEMQGEDDRYLKNGSTFFNSGYVDYLDENYTPKPSRMQKDAQMFQNVAKLYE